MKNDTFNLDAEFLCHWENDTGHRSNGYRETSDFTEFNGYSWEMIKAVMALNISESVDLSDGVTSARHFVLRIN